MKKVRLSYSLLDKWMRGQKEEALNLYLHLSTFTNKAIERGREFDKMCEEYIIKNKALPNELGGETLINPMVKVKTILPYNEMFDLSYEMDMVDSPYIYEFKCSQAQSSAEFADTLQIPFYFMVSQIAEDEPSVKLFENIVGAWIYRFDPIYKTYDTTYIWKSESKILQVIKAIDTHGPEIYKFFENEVIL